MTKAPAKYRAPALDKGLDILELLAAAPAPMSITEISEGVGRSRGEIFRMLQVLEERDYIERGESDSSYSITTRLFRLGMEQPPVKSALETAFPIMHRLADEIDQSCHLVVPSGEQIVVVARVDPPGEIGLVVRVGHRRPMSQSASGQVLLAFQSDEIRIRWLQNIAESDPEFDRKKLLRTIRQIQSHGHAISPSQVVDGITDLSAPVMQHGHAVCALTVPFIERRRASIDMDATLRQLHEAASEISEALQYGSPSRVTT
ncbi:IclR family transcriptional regulator [Dyella sp. A6]|uniref:IclR family transcriptional regulator n=1 Tax=Dyella aluminiiresistens TaxID=3069105 RepID=UPI002E776862|nr:IclR family transcriptional regulator [Dyella sp. A6]